MADAIKIKRQDTLRKIFTEEIPLVFREMMLAGKHNGITIIGVADCVIFYKGFPLLLLDYKFKRKVTIYDDELLQAGLFSYLLNSMGFDTSHIRYGVVAADSELKGNRELSKIHHDIVSKYRGQSHIDTTIDDKQVFIALKQLDIQKFTRELDWALSFWMKQREPVPTKNERKCMKCDFKDTCQFSLVRIKGS